MQYEISDDAAIEFSRSLYEAIADMLPVDTAVAEARKSISFALSHSVEWGTPVLYMRAPNGVLFKLRERPTVPESIPVPTPPAAQQPTALPRNAPTAPADSSATPRRADDSDALLQRLIARFDEAISKQDWEDVIRRGEQILSLDDEQAEIRRKTAHAYDRRSTRLHKQGDYDGAITDDDRAIELDPKQATFYQQRGVSYHEKGDFDRAIADYDRAIKLDPKQATFYRSRGVSYYAKGDFDRAIADYDRAIELDPKNGKLYSNRGLTHKAMNNTVAARRDFQRAVELGYTKAEEELKKLSGWRSLFG